MRSMSLLSLVASTGITLGILLSHQSHACFIPAKAWSGDHARPIALSEPAVAKTSSSPVNYIVLEPDPIQKEAMALRDIGLPYST